MVASSLKEIVSLAKRRGFIFPASEIYGGFANTYSYGPLGSQLKKNVRDLWWKLFVEQRADMYGLDGPILLHPKTWHSSGHVGSFADALCDCKECKSRFRVDHLIEGATGQDAEALSLKEMDSLLEQEKIHCPKCGKHNWTPSRQFNLMFKTSRSLVEDQEQEAIYLRPETAQAIFIEFKNICDSSRARLPFGIAQIGKAFRNEITPGNFIFRTIEFEQMEIEYFVHKDDWQEHFDQWLKRMHQFTQLLGLPSDLITEAEHAPEKLSHYSKRTVDLEFAFPFGVSELYGLAYRTDYDLMAHQNASGKNLLYTDPVTNERFTPHVLEPTFGLDRTILALLCAAYEEQTLEDGSTRNLLRLDHKVAPIQVAVFPLMKKAELTSEALEVFGLLRKQGLRLDYDTAGAIGKRYRRQDEIGTPYCLTIDYDTLEQKTVTVRCRDSMEQTRIAIDQLPTFFKEKLSFALPDPI